MFLCAASGEHRFERCLLKPLSSSFGDSISLVIRRRSSRTSEVRLDDVASSLEIFSLLDSHSHVSSLSPHSLSERQNSSCVDVLEVFFVVENAPEVDQLR